MSEEIIYIDGTGHVLGRLSSWLAKKLMTGQKVVVVNAQNLLISGRKRYLIEDRLQKRSRATHTNPRRGPFYPRFPDRILRRTVRGMLPWKTTSGRRAFRRLSAFIEIPDDLKDRDFMQVEDAMKTPREYMTVGELARTIGWQHGVNN